ncbi:MAG TPA: anthranilate synthase component I family protein [Polyangiaceae bacterium]
MPVVRIVRLPPDPLALARAVADRPGLAVLVSRPQGAPRPEDARWSFVACEPVESSDDLVPPPAGEGAHGGPAPRWIGVIPYEALRETERFAWTRHPDDRGPTPRARPAWRRYAAVLRIDHATGEVAAVGDDEKSVASLVTALRSGPRSAGRPALEVRQLPMDEPDEAHLERVRAALRLIAAGDLYEVNLARRIRLHVRGDRLTLLASLLDAAPAPWGFLQVLGDNLVCGASPELALSVRGDTLRTCPVKGTRPRGSDANDDARLAVALDSDPKERAELTMAVDVHRSDLGRVAVPGSVRVLGEPRVLPGRTVWSRVAEVVARRAAGATLDDVARAVLPCGSITGAPKVRAMEVIAQLEPWRRGAYTGAFGWVGHDGRLELAMAIRTVQGGSRDGDEAEYFAGGGIVADSVPERELEETRWKAIQLESLSAR